MRFLIWTFFLCGMTAVQNTLLVTYLHEQGLPFSLATHVHSCFYAGFVLGAIAAGWLIRCNVQGTKLGIGITTVGVATLLPSVFLGQALIGFGISCIQVCGNPWAHSGGHRQLAIAQTGTAAGMLLAPLIASKLLLGFGLTSHVALFATLWLLTLLAGTRETQTLIKPPATHSVHTDPAVLLGALGIALAVGLEIGAATYLPPLFIERYGWSAASASQGCALYWGGFLIGRSFVSWALTYTSPKRLIVLHALLGLGCTSLVALTGSPIGAILCGIATSGLFPLIFGLTLENAKGCTGQVAALLCIANIGGGIIPYLQSIQADQGLIAPSFWVLALCFTPFLLPYRQAAPA